MGCIANRWLPQGTNLASSLKPHHICILVTNAIVKITNHFCNVGIFLCVY